MQNGLVKDFKNFFSSVPGILSTVVATIIVTMSPSNTIGWKLALSAAASVQVISVIVYLIFASAEEQSWTFDSQLEAHSEANACAAAHEQPCRYMGSPENYKLNSQQARH